MWTNLTGVALVVVAAAAMWFDVRERRLPNALTVGAFGLALLLRMPQGLDPMVDGLLARSERRGGGPA